MTNLSGQTWKDLKNQLLTRWHESRMDRRSLMEFLERKIGIKIERASEHMEEMAEHYHLYDEPAEKKPPEVKEESERVLELNPQKNSPPPETVPHPFKDDKQH